MKNAIVTGATGFVGSNLCRELLNNGWQVSIIVRPTSSLKNIEDIKNDLDVFIYDDKINNLIDFFNSKKADVVFHLASLFIAEHKSEDINNLVDSNLKFGLHILEAMKESNTKLLVNTGTSWEYYHSNEYSPVDLYAATKHAFESLISYYVELENLKVVTLKLFDTYGETDTRPKLINLLNTFSDEGKTLEMSPGEQMLDLVHISDVTNAFLLAHDYLLNTSSSYSTFGVSSGNAVRLKDLIKTFEMVANKKINVVWGAREYRKREVMSLWLDFETLPGWVPKIGLSEGLAKYKKD